MTAEYATADGTATAGSDYESASGRLAFAPGEVEKTIRVSILDDALDEPEEETFAVALSAPSGAALGDGSATGTIRDDDGTPTLSVSDAAGSEGGGALDFAVSLSAPSGVEVTAEYATADGTATAGSDYESASGRLAFAPGEVEKTIRVSILDDALDEPEEETFAVALSAPSGAALGDGSATGTIRDDDGTPTLSVSDAAGSEGGGALDFAVTLSAAAGVEVTAEYATADGTATAGSDYESASGRLAFAPGEVEKTIRVSILDDALDEPEEETFAVALSAPSGAALGDGSATGTIRDDDGTPTLSVSDAAGSEGGGALEFAVSLSAASGVEVTAEYATADGTATAGSDYESASGRLAFAPGEVEKTIRVSILDDALDEPEEETFAVALSAPSGAALGDGSATGTIRDDDGTPTLSVSDAAGSEGGGALDFAVTLSAPSGVEVTAEYATADGTATAGSDYESASGRLAFAPGEVEKTIRVSILDDALDEPEEETFAVALSAPSGAALGDGSATGTIRDDDAPPTLSVSDAAGSEGGGALEFAVSLSAPSGVEVTAEYATADGTATAGSDYESASGRLAFAPGEVEKTIRVSILDDALDEPEEETFAVALSAPSGAALGDGSATGTIRDDDATPPILVVPLPDAALCVGGAGLVVDLSRYFLGEALRYSVVSSVPEVAAVTLAGEMLTVMPVSEGRADVTVTAINAQGETIGAMTATVVTDPAEQVAIDAVLASIGGNLLGEVAAAVDRRFGTAFRGASTGDLPTGGGLAWERRPSASLRGVPAAPQIGFTEHFSARRSPQPQPHGAMRAFTFAVGDGPSESVVGGGWSFWGQGGARRFEGNAGGVQHEGSLSGVHLGADMRVGDWLAGVSVSRSAAEADYRFARSVNACGTDGTGEGLLDVDLTSVHPYVGRWLGGGWVWAVVGAGWGETAMERCGSGRSSVADLSMRLAVLGGHHPLVYNEGVEWSLVEDVGVLRLGTGEGMGPIGDRSVSVGRARFGLEASGVAPLDCPVSVTTFVRALVRGDYGDGDTGAGLEAVAGARYLDRTRRLGVDAAVRTLVVHSSAGHAESGLDLTVSILPKADGTGLRMALWSRRGAFGRVLGRRSETFPWAPGFRGGVVAEKPERLTDARLGYGFAVSRGLATAVFELDAGHAGRGVRLGLRYEVGDPARGFAVEWDFGRESRRGHAGNYVSLTGEARF